MKTRIRTYYQFGRFPFYCIEKKVENHWISVAKTVNHDKKLALKIKKIVNEDN